MVGTPLRRTRIPLQKWFYAMYLFTATRHGVPAKELQRQLGVNYKWAWRMGHELPEISWLLLTGCHCPLSGTTLKQMIKQSFMSERDDSQRGEALLGQNYSVRNVGTRW